VSEQRGRVTGLGGVFVKSRDPAGLLAWYSDHLHVAVQDFGASFRWRDEHVPERRGATIWGVFDADTGYFAPSDKPYMLNFRVDDLDALLARLRAAGVTVESKIEQSAEGRFAWIMDPDGTRVELWEPPASEAEAGEVVP
jgi:predicted enzyme related to lactoylglutathione lyase